ncbi:carboxypeptidase regulatory-like domain-containing protein, partial [candidate division KSB1 bacterium]|nr:carboxypeptidase regulatory-like domain-containing protein [candidate division KSB1 bacterium]
MHGAFRSQSKIRKVQKMKRFILLIAAALLFCSSAFAQQSTGTISGTVTYGPDKAVVHNVSIRIKELERVAATDDLGTYRFTGLAAGTYHLTTHIEGFKDVTSVAIVRSGETTTVDFDIKLAG